MKPLAMTTGLLILATAAIAGPFDFIKKAAPSVPGGAKVAKYVEPASKVFEAAGVDTPEGRQKIGQAVALAATAKYNGLDDRDSVQAYVTLVGLTVANAADPNESHGKYVFGVLNSPDATACSGPGGYVMITRGALDMMDDESELAGVLAHEIAHVYKNNGIDAVRTSKLTDAGVGAASAADNRVAAFNNVSDNLVTTILEKGYSRGQESDADKLAVQFVMRAGYDPDGYTRFLKKLEAAKASGGGAFATHPSTKDRVKTVERLAKGGGATLADRFHKNAGR
jgi:beta-barrel assembly-enhancing protease